MHSNTENLVCKPSTFTPSRCCGRPLLMRSFQTAKRKSKHASRLHLFHEFQDICRHRELSHINLYVDRDVENSFLLILRGLAKKRELPNEERRSMPKNSYHHPSLHNLFHLAENVPPYTTDRPRDLPLRYLKTFLFAICSRVENYTATAPFYPVIPSDQY